MDATRITLARVLELGIRVSWHEATAIVHGAVAATVATEGSGPAVVTPESCVLTRAGDVVLAGRAAQARPEVVVRLLDDLLAFCSYPGRFAGAVDDGTALDMIEELNAHIPTQRRRVEVASVALRGLAAEVDAAREMADPGERGPSADLGDSTAAPTPAASPTTVPPPVLPLVPLSATPIVRDQRSAPSGGPDLGNWEVRGPGLDHEDRIAEAATVRERTTPENAVAAVATGPSPGQRSRSSMTLWPASFSMDFWSAAVKAVRTAQDVRASYTSRFDWERAVTAALVCSALALTAGGILVLRKPAPQGPAVEQSEPAIAPSAIDAPVGPDGRPALARSNPAVLPKVADPPVVPRLVARSAPQGSRIAQASLVKTTPLPTGRPVTPARNAATVAASRASSTTSPAASLPAPAPAPSGAAPPAVEDSFVADSPSATPSPPAEAFRAASTAVPANAVARSQRREDEARAIENLLGRYRNAFNNLDAGAAAAVWPTVNEKTLAKAFDGLESHNLSFENCQIEVFSVLAEASCSGSARYVPKVGSRTPKNEARRWKFSLRRAMDGWLIERVDAR